MTLSLGHPLHVLGKGFFSSGHASAADVAGDVPPSPRKPAYRLLEGRARRFTSLVMQMHVEVCEQAMQALPAGLACGSVFCSNHGEVQTAADIIADIREHQTVSSARFAVSVHNSPSGVYSIATRNAKPTTTVTGGAQSFAAGLLEAVLTGQERQEAVLLSFADEPVPEVFGGEANGVGMAAALLLSDHGPAGVASLGALALEERVAGGKLSQAAAIRAVAQLMAAVDAGREVAVCLGALRDGFDVWAKFAPGGRP